MPNLVLLEEFDLTLSLPASTTDKAREVIRRTVNGRPFRAALRRAILQAFRTVEALTPIRLILST